MRFDTVLMVDWSGGNDRGPTPKADAIWYSVVRGQEVTPPVYCRNRQVAEAQISGLLQAERDAGRRVLAGFDFAFGYPEGFGKTLTGSDDPFAIWDWFADRVKDAPYRNNRFDLAGEINALFPGIGPFWGNGLPNRDIPHLPRKGTARRDHGMTERRKAEAQAIRAFPVWQLSGAGAVGSQVIMGLPTLARLRRTFGKDLAVWPFEALERPITIVEIWPSLISDVVAGTMPGHAIKDAHQVQLLAQTVSRMQGAELAQMLDVPASPEGWIFGLGHEDRLKEIARASQSPPPLKNDCFAMPQGAHWTPVAEALAHLQTHLSPVTAKTACDLSQATGRYLAQDVHALRSHPPTPNAAVDGYGFAGPAEEGLQIYPLVNGRSAAGQPFGGVVPTGHAIRILTGAVLPEGVDTVVLQEDVAVADGTLRFHGPLKKGANARKAGEDMQEGAVILPAGRKLTPGDIGMLAAAGVGSVPVRERLRVGVLSTGDELVAPGEAAGLGQIYDANRPMLAALLAQAGYEVVDLGSAPDNRATLRGMLDDAATRCDAILTSGGASAGAEDHVSALLEGTGSFALWRIAMKPGRPLVLGLWNSVPVFGLPGNPVAAMVCTLIFAAPALRLLAGGGWRLPTPVMLPAAFTKSKKPGRREYLRARVTDGAVEVFASEGSGRVSGLSWATGLVELGDEALSISPGDPVPYYDFGSFTS